MAKPTRTVTVLDQLDAPDDGPMGLVFVKATAGVIGDYRSDRHALVFARSAARVELRLAPDEPALEVDAFGVLILPPGSAFRARGVTSVCELAVLFPEPALIVQASAMHGTDFAPTFAAFQRAVVLPRTNWLNELMHRYVFERVVLGRRDNAATRFLEPEIVKEVHYRVRERDPRRERLSRGRGGRDPRDEVLRRAMAYIEGCLFQEMTLAEIAAAAAASASSVQRAFKDLLDTTPFAYVAERRLDEAYFLLKCHRWSVGQVADLVGYESQSAFGSAFKRRFGCTPAQAHER